MNPWQLAQQLRHVLANVRWTDGSKSLVFGAQSAYVYAGSALVDEELPPGFPFVLVTLDTATPDPDEPDLLLQGFSFVVAVEVAGDALGEHAVIGSSRADLGSSAGAGVAEVSERVRSAVQSLTGADGVAILLSGTGTSAPATVGRGRHVVSDEYKATALCTSQPVYAAPDRLRHSGGVLSWRGARCAARFDFLRYRVGYVAGGTPATTPAECAGIVYTGTNTEFHTSTVAGRVYSVFADYDPRGTGTVAGSSDGSEVGAFVVL